MSDRSMEQQEGILEDVLVKVGKFVFPVDFVVMHHLMEDTLQEIKQPIKFSSQDSTGLRFLKTVLNG